MLSKKSFRQRYFGFICILVLISSTFMGFLSSNRGNIALDMTRTAICCGNQTTEALIIATQTSAVIRIELEKIQPTQTYISHTRATLDAQLHITPTPK